MPVVPEPYLIFMAQPEPDKGMILPDQVKMAINRVPAEWTARVGTGTEGRTGKGTEGRPGRWAENPAAAWRCLLLQASR